MRPLHLNWIDYLREAYLEAKKSLDPSTQNGALLVNWNGKILAKDHNRFPTGYKTDIPERWERPLKYEIIGHAERTVICDAAKRGIKTDHLIMVCPWAACNVCAQIIVDSGVKTLVTHSQALLKSPESRWEKIKLAHEIFDEAGVELISHSGRIGGTGKILHSGQLWEP